jgi:hypothetical protein
MTRQHRLVSHVACDWCVWGLAIIINQKPENISQTSSGKVKCACSTIQYENAAPLHYSSTTTSKRSTSHHEAACCSTYARTGYSQPIFAKTKCPSVTCSIWILYQQLLGPQNFDTFPNPPSQINLVFKPSSNHRLFFSAAQDEMSTELYQRQRFNPWSLGLLCAILLQLVQIYIPVSCPQQAATPCFCSSICKNNLQCMSFVVNM